MNIKKILCYVALVVLVILIILPPALRLFVKDDVSDTTKDVVVLLTCNKGDEEINMSYKNGTLMNIKYSFMYDNTNFKDNDSAIKKVLEGIANTQMNTVDGKVTYRLDTTINNNMLQLPSDYKQSSNEMNNFYVLAGYECLKMES